MAIATTDDIKIHLNAHVDNLSTAVAGIITAAGESHTHEDVIRRLIHVGASRTAIVTDLEKKVKDDTTWVIGFDQDVKFSGNDPSSTNTTNLDLAMFHEHGFLPEHVKQNVQKCDIMKIHKACISSNCDDDTDDEDCGADIIDIIGAMTQSDEAAHYLPKADNPSGPPTTKDGKAYLALYILNDQARQMAALATNFANNQDKVGLDVVRSAMYITTTYHVLCGVILKGYQVNKHMESEALGACKPSTCSSSTSNEDSASEDGACWINDDDDMDDDFEHDTATQPSSVTDKGIDTVCKVISEVSNVLQNLK